MLTFRTGFQELMWNSFEMSECLRAEERLVHSEQPLTETASPSGVPPAAMAASLLYLSSRKIRVGMSLVLCF